MDAAPWCYKWMGLDWMVSARVGWGVEQGCVGGVFFCGAGRGKGKNPRYRAKKSVNPLIHKFNKSTLIIIEMSSGDFFL